MELVRTHESFRGSWLLVCFSRAMLGFHAKVNTKTPLFSRPEIAQFANDCESRQVFGDIMIDYSYVECSSSAMQVEEGGRSAMALEIL